MVNLVESPMFHTGTLCISELAIGETCEGCFRTFLFFMLSMGDEKRADVFDETCRRFFILRRCKEVRDYSLNFLICSSTASSRFLFSLAKYNPHETAIPTIKKVIASIGRFQL